MASYESLFRVDSDVEEPFMRHEIDSPPEPNVALSGSCQRVPPRSSTGGTLLVACDGDGSDQQAVKPRQKPRPITFAEVLKRTRYESAQRLFEKACLSSKLRKLMIREGRRNEAKAFALVKVQSACRAHEVAPDLVSIVQADDAPHLLSVRFRNQALHIPKSLLDFNQFDLIERN